MGVRQIPFHSRSHSIPILSPPTPKPSAFLPQVLVLGGLKLEKSGIMSEKVICLTPILLLEERNKRKRSWKKRGGGEGGNAHLESGHHWVSFHFISKYIL